MIDKRDSQLVCFCFCLIHKHILHNSIPQPWKMPFFFFKVTFLPTVLSILHYITMGNYSLPFVFYLWSLHAVYSSHMNLRTNLFWRFPFLHNPFFVGTKITLWHKITGKQCLPSCDVWRNYTWPPSEWYGNCILWWMQY